MEPNKLSIPVGKSLPNILVVDNDPDIIEFLNQVMRIGNEKRFILQFATTGEGAVGIVNLHEVDAAVVDIGLPDITGIKVGEMIKEHHADMPIAVFTSYSGEEITKQIYNIGAVYWYKPEVMANPIRLLDRLYNLVSNKQDSGSNDGLMTAEELVEMKKRRRDQQDRIPFPRYLLRTGFRNF